MVQNMGEGGTRFVTKSYKGWVVKMGESGRYIIIKWPPKCFSQIEKKENYQAFSKKEAQSMKMTIPR